MTQKKMGRPVKADKLKAKRRQIALYEFENNELDRLADIMGTTRSRAVAAAVNAELQRLHSGQK